MDGRRLDGPPAPAHRVDGPGARQALEPDGAGFVTAVASGLGWGALLAAQLAPLLASGDLVRLGSRDHVDVPLYWQRWRLPSAALDRLSELVRRQAARGGIRPERGRKGGGTVSVATPTVER